MGKILYLECNSGISGDMTVGALLDLGADRAVLENALESLGVGGYHLHFGRTLKCGLDAFDFEVHLEEDHEQSHEHGEDHHHKHSHEHAHAHSHTHRNLPDIYEIIGRLDSNDEVKALAKKMFLIVAEAEAKAHGLPVDEVHFHEVGAIDSIVDIISVAVCLDNLGIKDVVVSPLAEGHGQIRCQHGVIPVPVPATANIASAHGLLLRMTGQEGEMVTPTGAAIAAAVRTRDKLPAACRMINTGMGAGKKEFTHANVLRAMLLETDGEAEDEMWVLESNIDDCGGEMLGFAMEMLLDTGAADVWSTPVCMKKNRPAYMLSVLCREDLIPKLEAVIFEHTTTIGIRRYSVARTVLERRKAVAETRFGKAEVKICTGNGKTYFYPEYESVRTICKEQQVDFQTVYYEVRRAAEEMENNR